MEALVWILAGIFLLDVMIVAILGLGVEVARRRDRREVRELERLYEAPPASLAATMPGDGGIRGRHVAVGVQGPRGTGVIRSPSFVLVAASIAVVIVAGLLSPADRATTRGAPSDDTTTRKPVLGPRFVPREPSEEAPRSEPSAAPLEEQVREDAENLTGGGVVRSGGEETVPETVAAQAASATTILLEWSSVEIATGYRVDRWVEALPQGSSGWVTIAMTAPDVSTHQDIDLEAATTYYYRVTAQLSEGEAPASDVVSATTAPPAAPLLTAASDGGMVTLGWDDVEGEIGFRVERSTSGESDWTVIATTEAGVIAISDGNVSPGASYRYRVLAAGQGQDSPFSNVVLVTLPVSTGEETPTPDDTPADPAAIDPNAPPAP